MQRLLFSSLPNLITLARIVLVPIVVAMIAEQRWVEAFVGFVLAAVSDAVDGWLARRFGLQTMLGAYLDPLADKALLVSIYVSLAIDLVVPPVLAIFVVARDIMIIGAIVVSWLLGKPVEIRPLWISKANTAAQLSFAAAVLAAKAFGLRFGLAFDIGVAAVGALTITSAAAYLRQWMRHMGL
jgi:cardiolipin synthase